MVLFFMSPDQHCQSTKNNYTDADANQEISPSYFHHAAQRERGLLAGCWLSDASVYEDDHYIDNGWMVHTRI